MAQKAMAIFTLVFLALLESFEAKQDFLPMQLYTNIFPNQTFKHKTSNDLYMDPCKSGLFTNDKINSPYD